MDITMDNNLDRNFVLNLINNIKQAQESFLQSNIGTAINNAVDSGLKAILPDFIEEEVIDVKNSLLKSGLKEGMQTAINNTIKKGKEVMGMVTGNIEDINQIGDLTKNGNLIKNIANVLENVVDKTVKNETIKATLGSAIKAGENIILSSAENNVNNLIEEQVKGVEKVKNAINNWKNYFEQQNFNKMETEYKKIKNGMKEIMALENIIVQANEVENLHSLIKNNGKSFELTEEQLEIAKKLM